MTTTEHDAMWITAATDVAAEQDARVFALAKVATASYWPFLAGAASQAEYAQRVALCGDRLDAVVHEVTGSLNLDLKARVQASLDEDFTLLLAAKQASRIQAALQAQADKRAPREKFNLSDAKNEDGEWIMSPEQIRAEQSADEYADYERDQDRDDDDGYYGSRKTAGKHLNQIKKTSDPNVFSGTDGQGQTVYFKVSDSEASDLRAIMYGDLAQNFSGVEVDPTDVVMNPDLMKGSAKTAAGFGQEIYLAEGKCANCRHDSGVHKSASEDEHRRCTKCDKCPGFQLSSGKDAAKTAITLGDMQDRAYEATCPNPDCEEHGTSFVHDDLAGDDAHDDEQAECPVCDTPLVFESKTATTAGWASLGSRRPFGERTAAVTPVSEAPPTYYEVRDDDEVLFRGSQDAAARFEMQQGDWRGFGSTPNGPGVHTVGPLTRDLNPAEQSQRDLWMSSAKTAAYVPHKWVSSDDGTACIVCGIPEDEAAPLNGPMVGCLGSTPPNDPPPYHDPMDEPLSQYARLQKGAPFAGYADFDACVAANGDKDDPQAYCATIMRNVEDHKSSALHTAAHNIDVFRSGGGDDGAPRFKPACLECSWSGAVTDDYGTALAEASEHRNSSDSGTANRQRTRVASGDYDPSECPECSGTGSVPAGGGEKPEDVDNGYVRCPNCGGSGEETDGDRATASLHTANDSAYQCSKCGYVGDRSGACENCGGAMRKKKTSTKTADLLDVGPYNGKRATVTYTTDLGVQTDTGTIEVTGSTVLLHKGSGVAVTIPSFNVLHAALADPGDDRDWGEGPGRTPGVVDYAFSGAAPWSAMASTVTTNPGHVTVSYNPRNHYTVDTDADGSARYQNTPSPAQPDWIADEWDTGAADRETLDEGRGARVRGDIPVHARQVHANPYAPANNPYRTDGPGSPNTEFTDAQPRDDQGDAEIPTQDAQTTRPRVLPSGSGADGIGEMTDAVRPPGDPLTPASTPQQTAAALAAAQARYTAPPGPDGAVLAKITEITNGLLATNPGMNRTSAVALAQQTVARYPGMVRRR